VASSSTRTILLIENSLVKLKILQKLKKKRRIRQKTRVIYWNRFIYGEFHHLYPQLRADEKAFRQYTRMTINTFDYIVEKKYMLPVIIVQQTSKDLFLLLLAGRQLR
jgi:hypothetical protein